MVTRAFQATPPGEAGIHVVWIYGSEAEGILARFLSSGIPQPSALGLGNLEVQGKVLDEVITRRVPREEGCGRKDIIEVSLHGSSAGVQAFLQGLRGAGVEKVSQQEFLRHSYQEECLDACQLEAMTAWLQARTPEAASVFQMQASGSLSRLLQGWRKQRPTLQEMDALLASSSSGQFLSRPATMVLAGSTNAGKSTLLNALLGQERVIVSGTHGTTRDPVRESGSLAGYPFEIVDTAGYRDTSDPLEQEGLERTEEWTRLAAIVVWVHDGSLPWTPQEDEQLRRLGERGIVLWNKADLPSLRPHPSGNNSLIKGSLKETPAAVVADLGEAILQSLGLVHPSDFPETLLFTRRQEEHLRAARQALARGEDPGQHLGRILREPEGRLESRLYPESGS